MTKQVLLCLLHDARNNIKNEISQLTDDIDYLKETMKIKQNKRIINSVRGRLDGRKEKQYEELKKFLSQYLMYLLEIRKGENEKMNVYNGMNEEKEEAHLYLDKTIQRINSEKINNKYCDEEKENIKQLKSMCNKRDILKNILKLIKICNVKDFNCEESKNMFSDIMYELKNISEYNPEERRQANDILKNERGYNINDKIECEGINNYYMNKENEEFNTTLHNFDDSKKEMDEESYISSTAPSLNWSIDMYNNDKKKFILNNDNINIEPNNNSTSQNERDYLVNMSEKEKQIFSFNNTTKHESLNKFFLNKKLGKEINYFDNLINVFDLAHDVGYNKSKLIEGQNCEDKKELDALIRIDKKNKKKNNNKKINNNNHNFIKYKKVTKGSSLINTLVGGNIKGMVPLKKFMGSKKVPPIKRFTNNNNNNSNNNNNNNNNNRDGNNDGYKEGRRERSSSSEQSNINREKKEKQNNNDNMKQIKYLFRINNKGEGIFRIKKKGPKCATDCLCDVVITYEGKQKNIRSNKKENEKKKKKKKKILFFSFLKKGKSIYHINNLNINENNYNILKDAHYYNKPNSIKGKYMDQKKKYNISQNVERLNDENIIRNYSLGTLTNYINEKEQKNKKKPEEKMSISYNNIQFVETNRLRALYIQLLHKQNNLFRDRNFYKDELEKLKEDIKNNNEPYAEFIKEEKKKFIEREKKIYKKEKRTLKRMNELKKEMVILNGELELTKNLLNKETDLNKQLNIMLEENKNVLLNNQTEINNLNNECNRLKETTLIEKKENEKLKEEINERLNNIKKVNEELTHLKEDQSFENFRKLILQKIGKTNGDIKYLAELLESLTKELENKKKEEVSNSEKMLKIQENLKKNEEQLNKSNKELKREKKREKKMIERIVYLKEQNDYLKETIHVLKSKRGKKKDKKKKNDDNYEKGENKEDTYYRMVDPWSTTTPKMKNIKNMKNMKDIKNIKNMKKKWNIDKETKINNNDRSDKIDMFNMNNIPNNDKYIGEDNILLVGIKQNDQMKKNENGHFFNYKKEHLFEGDDNLFIINEEDGSSNSLEHIEQFLRENKRKESNKNMKRQSVTIYSDVEDSNMSYNNDTKKENSFEDIYSSMELINNYETIWRKNIIL
ncbi:conserved Plasmodium protein, unknown function [Plasmodium sp. gorilla clade G2]|uniref:conserved Plasmodium protein, unknown function n=1 Tax=Plasmodium sp. gorilla clade G2 TaxID=880535 RepID=UPI000D21B604|nr:conserved Plasmodium protein, unknown function [Plasmodium sp. gorilla clade G2]SOV14166.1 conserved Plasmodium protein, unknown function [Plasmodium sp. gorilla clade G2]